ncbi:hypothetical protein BSL82_12965 [Tardibacter chloracetimidivorans]|uniref:MobA-like NTP transferase domain-containing protein n=1 Tax=Tardibacter chloracetimidivorans TaxID=1921510 RepID=A0A1L3ZWU9_9SPHN|nr:nucleotidyltransferase family protein [Tardibacter chloracetimidivorans]API60103.1 hypothetical protein BSL82_12965 [Tardibacter chloracetimidivorans]
MSQPDAHARCHGIVLAAGAATRFDGVKLLADFRGQPLITWPVRTALDSPVDGVTVVLGSHADEVEAVLKPFQTPRLNIVRCARWSDGLSASLKCGLAALPRDCRAALIFLGDMPNLDARLAGRVLAEVLDGAPAAIPEFGRMPGHPVAVSSGLFEQLGMLDGDRGARSVLENLDGVVRVETDKPGCIQDVDTKKDLDGLA